MLKLTLRLDRDSDHLLGHGKIRLLEAIDEQGSISAAGRAMGMSYRRAWLLVDELNATFREPVVTTQHGGSHGGGAALTEFGRDLVGRYRSMETDARAALASHLDALEQALARRDGHGAR
jgi:molybdate transport system regulatory protein